jgi:Mn2+/Fe2+ NRAMP family transporter
MNSDQEPAATHWYFAVALFGAAMTPYEAFFFSSGAVEEHWTKKDLGTSRLNVLIGFPLGGRLSIAIATCATIVLLPNQIEVRRCHTAGGRRDRQSANGVVVSRL